MNANDLHVPEQDNLSRGNAGAISALRTVAKPGQLRFIDLDLGDPARVRSDNSTCAPVFPT
jgi:hypothetical protein